MPRRYLQPGTQWNDLHHNIILLTPFFLYQNYMAMKYFLSFVFCFSFHLLLFAQTERAPMDDIVPRSVMAEKRVLPYPSLREQDILWEKRVWRLIDTREKINLPFRYPKRPLFNILAEAASAGEATAYSVEDDQFSIPLSPEEVGTMLNEVDTVEVIQPESGSSEYQIVSNSINVEDIKRYRIKEVWYFDSRTSTMNVRILGIAPLKEEYDDNGNFKYERPLFWFYYPQCRELLARHKAPNPFTDNGLMSWEDIFEMRYFSSYIIKESNIHDQRLEHYLSGRELLLEADRIEQEIFNVEQDMWQY